MIKPWNTRWATREQLRWANNRIGMWLDKKVYLHEVIVDYKPALGAMKGLGCIFITQHVKNKELQERFVEFPRYMRIETKKAG